MRFHFIRNHQDEFPVALLCKVLEVSRSGYYAWIGRPLSCRAKRRQALSEAIRQAHAESRNTYGSPRVQRELIARGFPCSENTIAKLMRVDGIRSKVKRRFVVRTTDSNHELPIAPNRLTAGRAGSSRIPKRASSDTKRTSRSVS